jgi:threonine synthase
MDIQLASNFERLVFDICSCNSNDTLKLMNDLKKNGSFILKKQNLNKIYENFLCESLSESEISSVINQIYKKEGMLIDPHTAVGIGAMSKVSIEGETVVLATAHPSKFPDIVIKETKVKPSLPENLKKILDKKEKYEKQPKDLNKIKNYILDRV